eukprot:scaffold995_cov244-Pinguiococcus_pyrenoidosus.AAC.1
MSCSGREGFDSDANASAVPAAIRAGAATNVPSKPCSLAPPSFLGKHNLLRSSKASSWQETVVLQLSPTLLVCRARTLG